MTIAVDTTSHSVDTSGGTNSHSWSHACSGSDRTLVVAVAWIDKTGTGTPTVSDITYPKGGSPTSLTFTGVRAQVNYVGDNYLTVELWWMDDPDTGSNTVQVTLSEANDSGDSIAGYGISFTGSQGVGTNQGTGSGNTANPTVTFTTNESTSLLPAAVIGAFDNITFTPDGTETEVYDENPGTESFWFGYDSASGGSDTLSLTASSSTRWVMMAIEVLEAAGGEPAPSASDSVSISDTLSLAPIVIPDLQESESVSVAENVHAEIAIDVTASESITVGDAGALDPVASTDIAASEAVAVTDTPMLTDSDLKVVESEAAVVADDATVAIAAISDISISRSDSITIADVASLDPLLLDVDQSQAVTVTDAANMTIPVAGEINISASDSISVADSPTMQNDLPGINVALDNPYYILTGVKIVT